MRTTITRLAAALLLLAGCSNTEKPSAQPPAPTPAATYDGSTLSACKDAAAATNGPDKGNRHALLARSSAELSDIPALREVARKYSDDAPLGSGLSDAHVSAAAYTIYTWCIEHHVKE
jgi:hypothetical protein